MKWCGSFKGQFWSLFLKNWFEFWNFTTSKNELGLIERLQSWEIGFAKISAPSFRKLPDKLSMPAALDGFKTFKIFNIFSGDILENSKFESLNLLLS